MEDLTYDRAVELAREVVAEFGEDYVYPTEHKALEADGYGIPQCLYVHEDKPSCIVGQILHRFGVSLAELAMNEFKNARRVAELARADEKTRFFLAEIQSIQDKGESWGVSLAGGLYQTAQYYP